MNLAAMFDSQPGIAAHRAHAAGCRYTLPDYPVPGGVPIRAEGSPKPEPKPKARAVDAPRTLPPALAAAMQAAARLPARFTLLQLANALYGGAATPAEYGCTRNLVKRLDGHLRRVDSLPRRGPFGRPLALYEIVPDEEAGQA